MLRRARRRTTSLQTWVAAPVPQVRARPGPPSRAQPLTELLLWAMVAAGAPKKAAGKKVAGKKVAPKKAGAKKVTNAPAEAKKSPFGSFSFGGAKKEAAPPPPPPPKPAFSFGGAKKKAAAPPAAPPKPPAFGFGSFGGAKEKPLSLIHI